MPCAVIGIIAGFLLGIVPGLLAARSYDRWRAGSIGRPTFAWICALIGAPLLVFSALSFWWLYDMPLVQDDLSDPQSGWPVDAGPGWSIGYDDGSYRIESSSGEPWIAFLDWNEGEFPNVAVEATLLLDDDVREAAEVGVGCLGPGGGYFFVMGPGDRAQILAVGAEGATILATGHAPPSDRIDQEGTRVRGECRGGYDETRLSMYVNGTQVTAATVPDDGEYDGFTSIALAATGSSPDARVIARFDDARAIAIQPS